MKILVVDQSRSACFELVRGLNKTLGRHVLCASSPTEALRCLEIELDAIGVIVITVDADPNAGLSFIRKVKEFSEAAAIRRPNTVVLLPVGLRGGYDEKYKVMGAECIVHGFVQQVYFTVGNLISQMTREDGMPTILVRRTEGNPSFHLQGPAASEVMPYGPRVIGMVNHLAVYSKQLLSTRRMAEAADISLGYVRVYLNRIRAVYDKTRIIVGVDIPGMEVFWTGRKDGAYVHILKARVLFD